MITIDEREIDSEIAAYWHDKEESLAIEAYWRGTAYWEEIVAYWEETGWATAKGQKRPADEALPDSCPAGGRAGAPR